MNWRINVPVGLLIGGWSTVLVSLLFHPPVLWLFIGGLTAADIGAFMAIADWSKNLEIDTETGDVRIEASKEDNKDD